MQCPHITKQVSTQSATPKEHTAEDGQVYVCWEISEATFTIPTECFKEACGAWVDGECRYNGYGVLYMDEGGE
jgi:hypothetical protein